MKLHVDLVLLWVKERLEQFITAHSQADQLQWRNWEDFTCQRHLHLIENLLFSRGFAIIGLLGYYWEAGQSPMLVMDYMQNRSLDKWLFDASRGLTWDKRKLIALGVARGLQYLHHYCNPTILHLDIKPDNILLDAHLIPKIGDFGISKIMDINSGVVCIHRPL